MKADRLNHYVTAMVVLQVNCPHCKSEYEVSDTIDGNLFDDNYLHCVKCGKEISLRRF